LRSDPIASPEKLTSLYAQSGFDYGEETESLKSTYGKYLKSREFFGAKKGALLEIGSGNGFFLEEALEQGYSSVKGVEPGADAIAKASPLVRPHIICNIMREGLFGPAEFDAICMFQVIDHLPDPASVIAECLKILRPGGLILNICHNSGSLSARLLREKSPIVDIEHTFLFDEQTMGKFFSGQGFETRHIGSVSNTYSLYYFARLVPLPAAIKRMVLSLLKTTRIGKIRVTLPIGNMYIIAQKPA
jgi:SAM-dependent methyltransferase